MRSRLGRGTVFNIFLPAIARQEDVFPDEIERLPLGTEKVLFVDDEPRIAAIGKQLLERLGYSVEIRTDSRQALALFKARHSEFSLVITDMTMPHLTGDRMAREMLRIAPRIPIILCTGFNKEATAQRAADIGIKALAMKPLVREELARLVRKVIDEN